MNAAFFPCQIRQCNSLEVRAVILFSNHYGFLDFIDTEIAATPDDVAVTSFLESPVHGGMFLRLAGAVRCVDRLQACHPITLPLQPLDLVGPDIRIDDCAVLVFPKSGNDDAQLGAEGSEVALVFSGDGDVEDRHGGSSESLKTSRSSVPRVYSLTSRHGRSLLRA